MDWVKKNSSEKIFVVQKIFSEKDFYLEFIFKSENKIEYKENIL